MSTDEPVATKPPPAAEPEVIRPVTAGPGLASIKAQYLDLDHKRKLVTEYLPAEAAKELEAATFQKKKKDLDDAADSTNSQPKKKFKGRMKNRPREQRAADKDRLCPHLVAEEPCRFGEKCRFSHNITEYMSTKPPDLGEKCHLFETFGKCQYGLTCRFGSQHIKGDANVVNEELYKETKDKTLVKNILSKDVQHKLWKKKYDFGKANKLVKDIQAGSKGSKTDSKGNKPTTKFVTGGAIAAVGMAAVAGLSPTVADSPEGRRFSLSGPVTDEDVVKVRLVEKKKIDFSDKLYLAPLTTVGNLPFRRLCKGFGADITCGEMAMCVNLLQGQQSEWALLKRHASEDLFGVQLCGSFPDTMTRCAQLLTENIDVDFVDMNCGCPIDLIYKKGEGCALMGRTSRFEQIVNGMTSIMDVPLTVKIRTGIFEDKNIAHTLLPRLRDWGVSMVTVHGRSREQRYTRLADWDYINYCAKVASPLPVFGNGDIMSYEDARLHREQTEVTGLMLARGALIKPWVFTEIKEARDWDISSSERLDMLKDFVNFGLEHWGSDQQGVANTRRFLLEWLSFLYRYVPVGILEQPPQKINLKPPYYFGRDELETKMASPNCADWIQISEMLLGPVPDGFTFLPKHRANAYS